MDTFSVANPYAKDGALKYVGMSSFGQKRQVSVPMVVTEFKDGQFQTLFVGEVD
jgi:branched-chain amino acid transport system substrate-binding protein